MSKSIEIQAALDALVDLGARVHVHGEIPGYGAHAGQRRYHVRATIEQRGATSTEITVSGQGSDLAEALAEANARANAFASAINAAGAPTV